MAENGKKKKSENRYPGTDTQPWKVRNSAGKSPLKDSKGGDETFTGFAQANAAAQRFFNETGELLIAARA